MAGTLIITGSARGIGAATAIMASRRGYAVCVNYLQNAERAEQVVSAIHEHGGKAIAVQADVSNESEVAALFDTVVERLGPLVGLVNNAGITGRLGRLVDADMQFVRRILDVNVMGTLLCSREAIRRMGKSYGGSGGSIINISSRAAQLGSAHAYVHYAATKAAVETITIGLAGEVGDEGIRVNCVSAGMIETEIHAAAGDPERVSRIAGMLPLKRAGKPEEIATAVLWLLSDEASYCTGTILTVSGGR